MSASVPASPATSPPPPPATKLEFRDSTSASGLRHSSAFSDSYDEMPRHFAGGVASGDIDGDGDIDLFVTRGDTQANLLFINEGGNFSDAANEWGVDLPKGGTENYKSSGPSFADMDGDGDLDLFIGGLQNDPSLIFRNNGDNSFTNVTIGSGIDTMTSKNTLSVDWGDYDKDGDLDLVMAHWGTPRDRMSPGETETLWRNDSDGTSITFTAVSLASGIAAELALDLNGVLGMDHDYTFSPNFSDINADGYPDILNVSDFQGSQIFINNQDGTFSNTTDRTQITDSNGMGSAVGDFDNDGDMDWFVSSIDGNRLYENTDGTMINTENAKGSAAGSWGWGSCFADFNADGHLDIYQTNGWISNASGNPNNPYTQDPSLLWMADGNGAFSDAASDAAMLDDKQGRAVVCADFDNDRDIDVLLLINNAAEGAIYWSNSLSEKNTLQVTLKGPAPNTQAIGATITIKDGEMTQKREVSIGSNFTSHNPTRQFFGLGDITSLSEMTINWPDGTQTTQTNISANQDLVITHPDAQ